MPDRPAVPAPGADQTYERSIALLLHDGLRFTKPPLTGDQLLDLRWGLRMIALGQATSDYERDLFRSMLDHGWITTAPFGAPGADAVYEKPEGWLDKCGNCGASWEHIGFDYADGFNCRVCGACDSDE